MKKEEEEKRLGLDDLPVSDNTLTLGSHFFISDTLASESGMSEIDLLPLSEKYLNMPFRIRFTMILLCQKGSLRIRTQMKEYVLTRGSMLLIMEGAIGECLEISGDIKVLMMAFSSRFKVMEPGFRPSMEILSKVEKHPCLTLSELEFADITALYTIMRHRMEESGFQAVEELATSCLTTLFYYISQHIVEDGITRTYASGRAEGIYNDFLELVECFSLKHRDLAFYADRLCMTPKYLSRMVREASGRGPKEWINIRIMLEAEVLLRDRSRSIQEISDVLGFPNQSFFGTFFKKMKGISPSSYRNTMRIS
ncbi:MAG: helix-turn-helix domain-containing protein [Muribaculaceae bacterium]|nr:helix-turn-helix domain-containing protein [Muribaculaceae bacterium]